MNELEILLLIDSIALVAVCIGLSWYYYLYFTFKKRTEGALEESEFIHSLQYSRPNYFPMVYIVQAYIPKGVYYIEGKTGDIASTKLILDPRDVYKQFVYKFSLSDRIKFFLWRIIHLIK